MSYTGSKAQAGRGSTISIGSTPTLIGEVTDIPLSLPKWDTVDVTNFDSGSDSEFITTIRKSASFSIKGNRVVADAGQVACKAAYDTGTISPFTITLPKTATQTVSGDKYAFNALITGLAFSVQPTKQIDFSLDLQISGAVTFTAGS